MSTRVLAALLAALLLGSALTGCASLPSSSSPEAIGTINRSVAPLAPGEPASGSQPDQLLKDFLSVSRDPAGQHGAARQYLTEPATQAWNDSASVMVVDRVEAKLQTAFDDRRIYRASGNRLGFVQPSGAFVPDTGPYEAEYTLRRTGSDADPRWRVDALDAGVVLSREDFRSVYQPRPVYFVGLDDNHLVPDLRWFAGDARQLADVLVRQLVSGPDPRIAPAVRSVFAAGVTVPAPVTALDGSAEHVAATGGVRVDLAGADGLSEGDRERIAAQLVWTWSAAGIEGPYVITVNGQPLSGQFAQGWTKQALGKFDPTAAASTKVGTFAVHAGSLYSVQGENLVPVGGPLGTAKDVLAAAISRDGSHYAAVQGTSDAGASKTLRAGAPEAVLDVATAGSFSRPSWHADGRSLWTVVDQTRLMSFPVNPDASIAGGGIPVDLGEIALGKAIYDARLSPDGGRVVLAIDGSVVTAAVVPRPDGTFSVVAPTSVVSTPARVPVSVAWIDGERVAVAGLAGPASITTSTVDGAVLAELPSGVKAPVQAIDADASAIYAADGDGAVVRLRRELPESERHWEAVSAFGQPSHPIVPG